MNFICEECGNIFENGEEKKGFEPDGREWRGCPVCSGAYYEAKICRRCDEWTSTEAISWDGYCEKCVEELRNKLRYKPVDIVNIVEIADEKRACYLNSALLYFFSEEQITSLLIEALNQATDIGVVDCKDFLDECDTTVLHAWEEINEN